MKILFNIFLILILLIAFVPVFRRFVFHLLVGRQLIKEQERQFKARQQAERQRSRQNVNVDNSPSQQKGRSNFPGGEYVDYEEVK